MSDRAPTWLGHNLAYRDQRGNPSHIKRPPRTLGDELRHAELSRLTREKEAHIDPDARRDPGYAPMYQGGARRMPVRYE